MYGIHKPTKLIKNVYSIYRIIIQLNYSAIILSYFSKETSNELSNYLAFLLRRKIV
jgi:hypothetical protein